MAVVLAYLRPESEFRLKNVGLRPVYLYGAFSGVTLAGEQIVHDQLCIVMYIGAWSEGPHCA